MINGRVAPLKSLIYVATQINPLRPKGHYSGFVIKFIIKFLTHACLVL